MTGSRLGIVVLVASISCVRVAYGQENRGEIDVTPCFPDILRTTYSLTSNTSFAHSWLDIVSEEYFNQNNREVNATAEKTLGWKASASWKEFEEQRRVYNRKQAEDTTYKQSVQQMFNGITERAFDTIDRCIAAKAITKPNIYYAVTKNTLKEVQLRFYWIGLPGPEPAPFEIKGSTLSNGKRTDIKDTTALERAKRFWKSQWSDQHGQGQLVATGLKLAGNSLFTISLQRVDSNKAVVGSLFGPNFDQVFFNIEPPAKALPRKTKCSVSAKDLKPDGEHYYAIPFPPLGKNFPIDCSNLEPNRRATVTWSGSILPPQFPSYNLGTLVDTSSPSVNYAVQLRLLLRDGAGKELISPDDGSAVVLQKVVAAKDTTWTQGSVDVTVPGTGVIVANLMAYDSNKWPATLGPISLSDDFRITIQVK